MDTDSFVLSFSERKVSDEYKDLTNVYILGNSNGKVLGKFKLEIGSKRKEEFSTLSAETYSFKYCGKGISKKKTKNKFNNDTHEDYLNV